jgi:pimeloyl-ACP methyl ester carboxylesterase
VVTGTGPTVVQVHNAGWGKTTFERVTPLLAEHCRVIDFDMRGFGESDAPIMAYSVDLWADDLAELIRGLGLGSVCLHGTAAGGLVSINCAARHPEVVDRVVLTGSLAKYDTWDHTRRATRTGIVRALGKGEELLNFDCFLALSRGYLDSPDYPAAREFLRRLASQLTSGPVDEQVHALMVDADETDMLPKVKAKTLVLCAREEILLSADAGPSGAHGRYIAEHIPGAQLHFVDGASPLIEHPEQVVAEIVAFLG